MKTRCLFKLLKSYVHAKTILSIFKTNSIYYLFLKSLDIPYTCQKSNFLNYIYQINFIFNYDLLKVTLL